MDKDGKPSIQFLSKGVFDLKTFLEALTIEPSPADFPSRTAADDAAKAAGWSVKDAQGPNHRCPDCIAREREEREEDQAAFVKAGRGAYIEF